ncbi:MAG: hypothetical protein EOO32_04435 [Comamonadaceae bacterium]|nr:MAG: hypothetical protein EOO32_04435 [Comamonadaceae bacterium]
MTMSSPSPTLPGSRPAARLRRWCGWAVGAVAAVVLALVFLLYADPGFVVMMADQVWACF